MALVCRVGTVVALGWASVSCAAGAGPREDGRGAATAEVSVVALQNGAPSAAPSARSAPSAAGSSQARPAPPPAPPGIDAARFAVLADVCAVAKSAEAQCKGTKDGTMVDLTKLAGPTKRFSLEFKGERKTMVPTAATKKLLDAWGKESPEFWWNVVK